MHGRVAYIGVAFILLGAALLAAPTFGFETIAAERTTNIDVAEDSNAILSIEVLQQSVDGGESSLVQITNNADQSLTVAPNAEVVGSDRAQISSPETTDLNSGESMTISADCSGNGNPNDNGDLITQIVADGDSIEIERTQETIPISIDCTGNGNNPGNGNGDGQGAGFNNADVGDVTVYTAPGGDRQTVTFEPSSHLDQGSIVTIDLSDAAPDGVDYTQTANSKDVDVVQGGGYVNSISSDGVIEYTTGHGGNRDKKGETVELSIGQFATATAGGPFAATITREDTGSTATASFDVVDDGDLPVESVAVGDVPPNADPSDEATQTFTFTFGTEPMGSDQLSIDLSDTQGNGVDYSTINWNKREVTVQSGDGHAWYSSSDDTIRYQANDSDAEGDTIVIEVQGYQTASSGGPYTVGVYWDRFDYDGTDSFSIN